MSRKIVMMGIRTNDGAFLRHPLIYKCYRKMISFLDIVHLLGRIGTGAALAQREASACQCPNNVGVQSCSGRFFRRRPLVR